MAGLLLTGSLIFTPEAIEDTNPEKETIIYMETVEIRGSQTEFNEQVRETLNKYRFCPHYQPENSLKSRLSPPIGYQRLSYQAGTFADWIQNLPLKAAFTAVKDHRSHTVKTGEQVAGVVDLDIPDAYHECADAAMRLWAEYNFSRGQNFSLPVKNGKKEIFIHPLGKKAANAEAQLQEYLQKVMTTSWSRTLYQHLTSIEKKDLVIGDLIIHPNVNQKSFGHVYIILDMAESQQKDKLYLIGQGFMPAQDLHIIIGDKGQSWLTIEDLYPLLPGLSSPNNTYFRRFK